MRIPPPTLATEADGALVIRKDRPGGHDHAILSVIVNGSLTAAIVLIWLPFDSKPPASAVAAAVLIGLGITTLPLGIWGAVRHYRRIKLGQWRIDDAGIEFRSVSQIV